MSDTTSYNAEDVTILWGGAVVTGLANDSTIEVVRKEDAVIPKTGIQGDTAYSRNANRSGTVKLSLFSTAACLASMRRDAQTYAVKPLVVRNANADGGFIVAHEECMITKVPDAKLGKETDAVDVEIYVPRLDFD